uniref:Putative LOC101234602 [Hydra vulgaris] n=1 Tax=Lepeophtheirus salmonis TaxID=72036 RepID=A0A0K2V2W1_LEPSM
MDITHWEAKKFLTVIDCGPSRFAVWREVLRESEEEITRIINQIFSELSPPNHYLDNGRSFRSAMLTNLCSKWSVKVIFRCTYRPSGNGIIERHH